MVTAATLDKRKLFFDARRLTLLETQLLSLAWDYGWRLEAWAVFPNHYHFIAIAGSDTKALRYFIRHLHSNSARELNQLDDIVGRQVWFNYWETRLTFEKSYLARLNYVHQNAVRHGIVPVANQYAWCSAAWFEGATSAATVKTIYKFDTSRVRVEDDFE